MPKVFGAVRVVDRIEALAYRQYYLFAYCVKEKAKEIHSLGQHRLFLLSLFLFPSFVAVCVVRLFAVSPVFLNYHFYDTPTLPEYFRWWHHGYLI